MSNDARREPRFTSSRERRLWLGTAAAVMAIVTTLGVAQSLSDVLRQRGLLDAAFGFALLLVVVTIVTLGLNALPRSVEIGVALGVAAAYLLVLLRMAIPEERTHLIEYSVVAVFVYAALLERAGHGRSVPVPALLAFVATALLGAIDEGIQFVLPGRVFDPRDILFNVLAGGMAVTASWALGWAGQRRLAD